MKTPFKMKYSPVKGKLGDFFKKVTKKATPETKAKRAEAKTTRKAGESQYKADVRKKGETNKANKKVDKGELTKNIVNTKQSGDEAVRPKKATVANKPESKGNYFTFSGKKGDKFKYRQNPASNPSNTSNEHIYEFQRPGTDIWETSKTKAGAQAIKDLWNDTEFSNVEITPIQKKSPSKKRGYKMNRKK